MLDIKFIRENREKVKENCHNRKVTVDVDELLKLDDEKRKLETKIEQLRAKRNKSSKTKPGDAEILEMKNTGDEIAKLEKELLPVEKRYFDILLHLPNMTHSEVKISQDEEDNVILEENHKPTEFNFTPLDHVALAENLDLIDFERGVKVVGAKFYYLKNELALLELALMHYAVDIAGKHGYTPFITPDMARCNILDKMGFAPRDESTQVYNIDKSDLSLIGTAEITMGGYHKDEVIKEEELPKKYAAISHCFRTEAGSYSKASKGIFRVHQFSKVELFQYVKPEDSERAHKEILEIEKEIFNGLKIPYRVIDHSSADLGAPSFRTFDLEAWMPGKANKDGKMGDWAEITSTSNCTDYQARGLNIKYQKKLGEKEFLHMVNGTAVAVPRAIIAILENFQQKDSSIEIPEVLKKYLSFKTINQKSSVSARPSLDGNIKNQN